MLHRARSSDVLVAPEDDQRRKGVLHDLVGVRQAELNRVLGRQERHHAAARHVGTQVVHQVAEVVLLLGAHGAVGHQDTHALTDEAPDGVVGVDPGIDAGRRFELRPWGPKLDGDDVFGRAKGVEDS